MNAGFIPNTAKQQHEAYRFSGCQSKSRLINGNVIYFIILIAGKEKGIVL
jgi:hypothetical protein